MVFFFCECALRLIYTTRNKHKSSQTRYPQNSRRRVLHHFRQGGVHRFVSHTLKKRLLTFPIRHSHTHIYLGAADIFKDIGDAASARVRVVLRSVSYAMSLCGARAINSHLAFQICAAIPMLVWSS
jgi:hypothetical protein